MADENQPDEKTGADAPAESTPESTPEATEAKTDSKTEPAAEAAAPESAPESTAEPTDAKTDSKTEPAAEAAAPEAAEPKPEPAAEAEPVAAAGPQTLSDLADLRQAVEGAPPPEVDAVVEPKLDAQGRAYATGKRKDAVARVWLKPGTGAIIVNGRDWETYFARPVLRMLISQPLAAANRTGQYDVNCTVKGGGLSGQAGAVRHGVAKALSSFEPDLRPTLKTGGFLTRDSRVVERKKYGRHKARRSHQFSKR